MIAAVPTDANEGAATRISGHFGHASYFAILNTATGHIDFVPKQSHSHNHGGGCAPIEVLEQYGVTHIFCLGLGRGAYNRMIAAGLQVDCVTDPVITLGQLIDQLRAGTLHAQAPELCAGHHGEHHAGHHGEHHHHHS